MKKLDYLKNAVQNNLADNLAWIFSAFCVTKEGADDYKKDPYAYRLVSAYPQYRFVQGSDLVPIEDSSTKEPLFRFKDKITIDKTWAANVSGPIEVSIGNVIFNAIAILPYFGTRIPFIQGKLSVSDLEKQITPRLETTLPATEKPDPSKIYVNEYLKFRDSLVFLEQFAPITNWSATRKGITKSPDLNKYRQQLLKEYEGRLDDPVVFTEYEEKLKAFDREWLKDDPAFGTFLKGKVLDVSRKKIFLGIGMPERMDPKEVATPVIQTLEEGQPTDPRQMAAVLNGARFGSYSRGTETINGGVVAKSVIRVSSSYVVDMEDCGTLFGTRKVYSKDTARYLVNRTLVVKGKLVRIEKSDEAQHYVGQSVIVRSPAYCQAGPGDRLCKVCAGKPLSQFKEGLVIPMTEVSQLILTQSLKAMHGKVRSTAVVDLESALS